jgi:hypothetical protein
MKRATLGNLLTGALLAALLAACAEPGRDGSGPGQGAATTTTAPAAATTGPRTLPGKAPATQPTQPAGEVAVTGTVREGVEPNCLLLDAGGASYLLVGGERAGLRPGRRVAVTGRVDHDLLSTCQQGEPLLVASIEPVP